MSGFIDAIMVLLFVLFMVYIVIGYHHNKLEKQKKLDEKQGKKE
ncbi:MAG: hypothetical protein WC144_06680 [Sulfurimonas sp.]|jgi:hypothetical protein|nr:hypothetical protein [Sulfurimonadaceae bacterium]